MHPLLNIAVTAAREAGKIIVQAMDHVDKVRLEEKGQNDFVTEIDQAAERIIIEEIHKNYPGHGILAEESGHQSGNDYTWIIDPLDGTTNFIHGFPHFCVSIAVKHLDRLVHAVIYDPIRNELFMTSRGRGASVNDKRVRVSQNPVMSHALIATGFPHRANQPVDTYLKTFNEILPKAGGLRRAGSAALDLAYVAAGRVDGFWELGINIWDISAWALMIQEAGGLISDLQGGNDYLKTGNVVCGNPKIFKSLLKSVQPNVPAGMR